MKKHSKEILEDLKYHILKSESETPQCDVYNEDERFTLDLESFDSYQSFVDFCDDYFSKEDYNGGEEDYTICNLKNMPGGRIYIDDELFEYLNSNFEEMDYIEEYWLEEDDSISVKEIKDSYIGKISLEDYIYEYLQESGEVPEKWINYIDIEKVMRDWIGDFIETSHYLFRYC